MEVFLDHPDPPHGRIRKDDRSKGQKGKCLAEAGYALLRCRRDATDQHGGRENHHGRSSGRGSEGKSSVGASEVLEQATEQRRVFEGMRTDADERAKHEQTKEERSVTPTDCGGRDQGQDHQPEGQE